ncbi:DeoR/GlpR family DNA-binding transcription regulator [Bacillus sp. FSL K6-3431]|uniref:DeoR/GlpR family DNA-binding transcription regulator n=1 Tax=Bacillus sp. FSL K6-3431 TaxID=2921500 RepID=UPI0030FC04D7
MAVERQKKIREILMENGSVEALELVRQFGVSKETIRRDLNQMEKDGFIQKKYGGAILIEEQEKTPDFILPVHQRKLQYFKEKNEIGKRAAKLVQEEQIIILDAGTTTWCTVKYLHHLEKITVISNGLNVVEECSKNDAASIYLLGGQLRKNSMSLVGPQVEDELKKYNADYVFLGTSGFSLHQGFMSSDLYEAEIKRAMVSAGKKVVLLADHSKFERTGLTSFCGFNEVDILITSDLVNEEVRKEIEKFGVEVIAISYQENNEEKEEKG